MLSWQGHVLLLLLLLLFHQLRVCCCCCFSSSCCCCCCCRWEWSNPGGPHLQAVHILQDALALGVDVHDVF
jgi:hypothetical protein